MNQIESINFILPIATFVTVVAFGLIFMMEWRASRRRDFDLRKEEINIKREESKKSNVNKPIDEVNPSETGGYYVIELPDDKKSMFHDLLKGFEEYASIKGYHISISIDASIQDRIAFKFTLNEFGVTTSTSQVKKDLDEYIEKIRNGDDLNDLPEIINQVEHHRLIMALKNRISFLQQNHEVQKNVREFYDKFFQNLNLGNIAHTHPAVQINNGGIEMDQRKYIANNSANVAQGDGHENNMEANNINIGSTFNERKELVEKIDDLISLIAGQECTDGNLTKANRQLASVKDELEDEDKPDKSSIAKWLGKAKSLLETAKEGSELLSKAKKVFALFGLI